MVRRISAASLSVSLSIVVAGCGGPKEPVAPTDRITSTPIASSSASPPPTDDPRVVRCGIDDRPRPLSVAPISDDPPRELRAKPAIRFDRAPPPSEPPPAAPPVMPPPPDVPPPPPAPRVRVVPEDPRLSYGPVPASVTFGFRDAASLDVCEPLAGDADVGHHVVELAMTSSGRASEIRSDAPGLPSRFLRCAMERACQVTASSDAFGQKLFLPFSVAWEAPPPPPPPPEPPPPPPSVHDVSVVADPSTDTTAQRLVAVIRALATRCTAGKTLTTTTVVTLTFDVVGVSSPPPQRRASPFGGPGGGDAIGLGTMSPMAPARVRSITSVGTKTPLDRELVGCVVSSFGTRTVPGGTTGKHRVKVRWSP